MLKFYHASIEDTLRELDATAAGLQTKQAEERLEKYGKNQLTEGKKIPLWKRFLAQLADPMTIILIVAAVISAFTTVYANTAGEGGESFADVIIIMAVVLINAVLGVFQESKAEKAIEALQKMSAATSKVLRDGNIAHIHSADLVPGDIILLEAGDAVPADGRLIECASLQIEEAALTGESVPVNKTDAPLPTQEKGDVPLGDRKNMAYMGSTVVYGRGKMVVTNTGMTTEMGKIADALANAQEGKTPLQIKLAQLSKILTYLVIGICVFIFAFTILRNGKFTAPALLSTFMIAVSLAVAAIPEGLATVVTIVLSIGVTNMSRRSAIIRKLTAVETLGCAQIICSDKTGTLTQNKMTVIKHVGEDEALLATAMALCSDAELDANDEATGEPTEAALVNYARDVGLKKYDLSAAQPRVSEAPFDSLRKMMSTVHEKDRSYIQYTKGAPDEVLKCCTSYLAPDGVILPMTEQVRERILASNKAMADEALRVLCAAMRKHETLPEDASPAALEQDLTYLGLTGMIDPIRPEVKAAIEECHSAGIRAVMITGDHIDTATAIARQLGIIERPEQAITGAALDHLSDEELYEKVTEYGVYARVQPEHKVRIVKAWQAHGCVTAMTGDGVNDAPSIKTADIGVGMGITGTDVTKNVADMVLADDNFATIVGAVGEGRRIYDNIRKAIQFLLSSNMSEVLSIFFATLLGFTILKPVHLLWINLITDCFPALGLGVEYGETDLMCRKPRDSKDGIFAGGLGIDVLYQGLLVTLLTLFSYFVGHYMEAGAWQFTNFDGGFCAVGMTMAFITMSMAEVFHSFNMRSQRHSIFTLKKQNLLLWGAGLFSVVLTLAVIFIPFLRDAFSFAKISFAEYGVALLIAFVVIPVVEVVKFFQRFSKKKN